MPESVGWYALKKLSFVIDDDGVPRIQWLAVVAFVVFLTVVNLLGFFFIWLIFNRNASLWPVGTQILIAGMVVVVVVELRRQRILTGRPTIRFGLASLLLLTTLIAVCLAFTLIMIRVEKQKESPPQSLVYSRLTLPQDLQVPLR